MCSITDDEPEREAAGSCGAGVQAAKTNGPLGNAYGRSKVAGGREPNYSVTQPAAANTTNAPLIPILSCIIIEYVSA